MYLIARIRLLPDVRATYRHWTSTLPYRSYLWIDTGDSPGLIFLQPGVAWLVRQHTLL